MSNPEEGGSSGQVPGRYKSTEMKVHSSDEWMAGSTKKYRKVFDRYETTYLRVEISFFNKDIVCYQVSFHVVNDWFQVHLGD